MRREGRLRRGQRRESKGVFNMKRSSHKFLLIAAGFVVALALVVGCGRDSNPLSPEPGGINPLPIPPSSQLALLGDGMDGGGMASEFIVASEGGTVSLDFCEVVIPPDALSDDTVISVKHADHYYAIFDMGPDGTQFAQPVMIRFNLDAYGDYLEEHGINPEDLVVALYDELSDEWLPLATFIDEDNNTWVVGYTTHFSRYALAD